MDLKKNYERFFGKMQKPEEKKTFVMNESQKNRFANISKTMAEKYPNAALTIKDGLVYVGYKKLEPVETFLLRSSVAIQETVRAFSASGKKGLL